MEVIDDGCDTQENNISKRIEYSGYVVDLVKSLIDVPCGGQILLDGMSMFQTSHPRLLDVYPELLWQIWCSVHVATALFATAQSSAFIIVLALSLPPALAIDRQHSSTVEGDNRPPQLSSLRAKRRKLHP